MSDAIEVQYDPHWIQLALNRMRMLSNPVALLMGNTGDNGARGGNFIAKVQVYITAQIDRRLEKFAHINEGDSAVVGQDKDGQVVWAGWATWQKTYKRAAYGGTVIESTRYRWRKSARGSTAKKTGRTWARDERKAMMALPVADRPPEKVWKKRAGGGLYDESSNMMRNTGRMRAGLFLVDVQVEGNMIRIRPGAAKVSYFEKQNDRRKMWFLQVPEGTAQIAVYAQECADDLARLISGRTA